MKMNNSIIEELLAPINSFLQCETPELWIDEAKKSENLQVLLVDHLVCELKAAQSAMFLIRKYAVDKESAAALLEWLKPFEALIYKREGNWRELADKNKLTKAMIPKSNTAYGQDLIDKMVMLIKEELHHFYQVLEIMDEYGEASMMASGLIVDGLKAFNNNLWTACETVNGWGEELDPESSDDLLKRDWVRRATKFATNYFGVPNLRLSPDVHVEMDSNVSNAIMKMTNCLKDCHNLHKWQTIQRTIKKIDFSKELKKKEFVDVDTMAGAGCSGGACDISLEF
jgi:tRNA isopentenyl-2-thiomethyl-A-37 hydroxylase MiaE